MSTYAFEGPKRSSDSVTWSFALQNYRADAATPFSDSIDAMYQSTIQAAFDRWASVSGLSFTQVADSASAGIRIGFGVFPSPYTVGETVVRSSGGVLPDDTVVRLLDPASDTLALTSQGVWVYPDLNVTLLQVAMHEIGHALGLAHTTDPGSLMYPVATSANRDLSAGDITGINTLYPLYTVTSPDAVQIEGNGATTTYHFVITRHNDLSTSTTIFYRINGSPYPSLPGTVAAPAAAFPGGVFPSGSLTFAAGAGSITLSVSVIGDPGQQADEGFSLSLSSIINTTTVRGTVNAAILDNGSAVSGSTIYRFFDTSDGTHFFTASAGERNTALQTRPDLVYEGAQLNAIARPDADPAATAVYRFFDTVHGTHFYTSSSGERDTVIGTRADLTYEGIAFYEHAAPQPGDTAVYRFFDSGSGTHFLTSAVTERATILATLPAFIDEGVAFYAPASA